MTRSDELRRHRTISVMNANYPSHGTDVPDAGGRPSHHADSVDHHGQECRIEPDLHWEPGDCGIGDCRAIGGQAATASSEAGSTAWNSWLKLEPSWPLKPAQRNWSRRSAPRIMTPRRILPPPSGKRVFRHLTESQDTSIISRQHPAKVAPCQFPNGHKPRP